MRATFIAVAVLISTPLLAQTASQTSSETSTTDSARASQIPLSMRTFDASSAFDGYFIPQRAVDGQEDR